MNDPVPPPAPSFKRTTDNRTWSSHSREGSKPYFSFHCLSGGLSKVHIPSSANRAGAKIKQDTMTIMMESFFIGWLRISAAGGAERYFVQGARSAPPAALKNYAPKLLM